MLASSWAKKAPFLWAVLVPLGIMGAEGWVFHSAHFARMVARHKLDWIPLAFNFDPEMFRHGPDMPLSVNLVSLDNISQLLTAPELWIGTAIAAAFVYGAIVLRRKRSEI